MLGNVRGVLGLVVPFDVVDVEEADAPVFPSTDFNCEVFFDAWGGESNSKNESSVCVVMERCRGRSERGAGRLQCSDSRGQWCSFFDRSLPDEPRGDAG